MAIEFQPVKDSIVARIKTFAEEISQDKTITICNKSSKINFQTRILLNNTRGHLNEKPKKQEFKYFTFDRY